MGLIIKDKLREFIKGYPTMSDKYNVIGGVLAGSNPVNFGDVVVFSSTSGYFEKPATITAEGDVAGLVVATNVKLAENWPGTTVQVNPGEAFNLLLNGYIAVQLYASVTISDVVPGANVYVTSTGAITGASTASAIKLNRYFYTGLYENIGTIGSPVYLAEVQVI